MEYSLGLLVCLVLWLLVLCSLLSAYECEPTTMDLRRIFSEARNWDLDIDRHLNHIVPPSPLHRLPAPVSRFLGYRKETRQDVGNILGAFWSMLGAFCGLGVVAAVFNNTASIQWHHPPALIASFVSTLLCGSC